jgi:uncharacterized tellurite resistance protein B-like protein
MEQLMSGTANAEKAKKEIDVEKTPVKSAPVTVSLAVKKRVVKKGTLAMPADDQASPKEKVKKEELIRDSFTMPESEYKVLSEVKKACLKAAVEVKKSELIRVAIAQLREMSVPRLSVALKGLTKIKAGRPKK